MSYIIKFVKHLFSKMVTKILRFLLKFTTHITKLNFFKIQLNEYSFLDSNKLQEYEPKDILKKYNWLVRKFEDPTLIPLGIMHHAFITNMENDIEMVEYGCETELKKDAMVKKTSLSEFLKENLNNEFYIFEYDKDHQNENEISEEKCSKRLGEKKYNFLTNTCEDLCVDVLIKPEFRNRYRNQIIYLLNYPLFKNSEKFYHEKTKEDLDVLKKFVPCKFNKETNKIEVYRNPLHN